VNEHRFQIVLVEDAEADVFLVREALENSGIQYELQVLDDGETALEFVEGVDRGDNPARPDLILLDLNLPKRSGVQILERAKQSPICGDVPVLILTSSDSPRDKQQVAQLKATEYFRKPSSLDEFMKLGALVRELLENSRKTECGANGS
jgi:CheY-like chemotaxis protein